MLTLAAARFYPFREPSTLDEFDIEPAFNKRCSMIELHDQAPANGKRWSCSRRAGHDGFHVAAISSSIIPASSYAPQMGLGPYRIAATWKPK